MYRLLAISLFSLVLFSQAAFAQEQKSAVTRSNTDVSATDQSEGLATKALKNGHGLPQGTQSSNICPSGGECPSGYPHTCPGSDNCWKYLVDAEKECGNQVEVCYSE